MATIAFFEIKSFGNIKIINQKMVSFSKNSALHDFLVKHVNDKKILVIKTKGGLITTPYGIFLLMFLGVDESNKRHKK